MSVPFTQVQTKTIGSAGAGSLAPVFTNNTSQGNAIMVAVYDATTTVSGVTDSIGSTYIHAPTFPISANSTGIDFWYAIDIAAGTTPTVTVTFSGSGNCGVIIAEYSGVATRAKADITCSATGTTGTTISTAASKVTAYPTELVIGLMGSQVNPAPTAGAGYGNLVTNNLTGTDWMAIEDKTVTTTGAQTITFGVAAGVFSIAGITFSAGNRINPGMDREGYTQLRPHAFSPGLAR